MKKFTLISALLICSLAGFSTTWTITNSGLTFTPATLTIVSGDDVNFNLEAIHDVVEVSQATWNINGSTPLSGGFSTGFGGGNVSAAKLTVGTHYYVCGVHFASGMKGTIIVTAATAIPETQAQWDLSFFPNPGSDILTVKTAANLVGTKYFITNQAGKQIMNGKISSETFSINISKFDRGVYLFQVEGLKGKSYKVIKN
jgi:plastocyanin